MCIHLHRTFCTEFLYTMQISKHCSEVLQWSTYIIMHCVVGVESVLNHYRTIFFRRSSWVYSAAN